MTPTAITLLREAARIYDDPSTELAALAEDESWRTGFDSGAAWMHAAMCYVRASDIPFTEAPFQRFGLFKYGLASLGALTYLSWLLKTRQWGLLPGVVLVFYGIEVQGVFLFPLMIDGTDRPLIDSLGWTQRAGGTLKALSVVIPLAAVMLFGGFFGGGFVRSWALGCLSVVIWYEKLRQECYVSLGD
jgi:hypothetical protein